MHGNPIALSTDTQKNASPHASYFLLLGFLDESKAHRTRHPTGRTLEIGQLTHRPHENAYSRYKNLKAQELETRRPGVSELPQMFNFEFSATLCVENNKRHQALWVIGRPTAVRPDAIGL